MQSLNRQLRKDMSPILQDLVAAHVRVVVLQGMVGVGLAAEVLDVGKSEGSSAILITSKLI